jgi:exodeoxyribonuclease VII small subunit
MTLKKSNNFNFENSIKELTSIVNEMEKGDLTLENALKNFEKGIKIIRECHGALENAEQKVQILVKKESCDSLETYQQK